MTGSRKTLILGCASTGAKFTPRNHAATGDRLLDSICTGATIRTAPGELLDEARQLYEMGCRYYHYHARNPLTQEQTTDNDIYQAVSRALQNRFPDLMLSFGASRNGSEVQENIRRFGEWERVSHCAIPLHLGGAHFVTIQAAIELQVICELEKQRRKLDLDYASSPAFLADLRDYQPSTALEKAELQTHSTSKGADYGVTSPMTQFQVYRNAIQARQKLGLFHEVEWVQHVRSYAMTRFAVEHPRLRLGGSGQLNVILLFGFSPRLPFPETYQQFRAVIESAKSLEYDIGEPGVRKRKVSITVGAAVMPQHAAQHFRPLDVGPRAGTPLCAVRRLAAYAAQADSQVDVLRVGMEDTPYAVDDDGRVTLSDNCQLLRQALPSTNCAPTAPRPSSTANGSSSAWAWNAPSANTCRCSACIRSAKPTSPSHGSSSSDRRPRREPDPAL
ncbi:3-keto-5-aminohexanoate cleavage protein, partial [Pseudomonas aeruginosa]|uniref:3-keto-5-aminohexanoate cleavage protein n=1 Tax=Pseudomonas aeruginosa TaxID=287 RepID=UPI001F3542FC